MDFRKYRKEAGLKPVLNLSALIPLADIGLLLVLFFTAVSGYCGFIPVRFDASSVAHGKSTVSFNELVIGGRQSIYLNGAAVTISALTGSLAGLCPADRPLIIKTTRDIPLSLLSEVWVNCRKAGVTRIDILTD